MTVVLILCDFMYTLGAVACLIDTTGTVIHFFALGQFTIL